MKGERCASRPAQCGLRSRQAAKLRNRRDRLGVRTRTQTFSQRRDSLTIFANDGHYGHLGKAGTWTGPDRTVVAACRRVLRAARILWGKEIRFELAARVVVQLRRRRGSRDAAA